MIRKLFIQKYTSHIARLSFSSKKHKIPLVISHCPKELQIAVRTHSILVKMSSEKKIEKPSAEKEKSARKAFLDEIKEKGTKFTRRFTSETEKNWKEYYLKLPLEEKRKVYSCGKKFVEIDKVDSWPSYAEGISEKVRKAADPLFNVDEELNMKISLWRGDITSLEIDVICNAANNSLLGGGGVDGAIHRSAGKKLLEECTRLSGCKTGNAKLSGGYKLPAKYILHTVGPIGENCEALSSCYKTCLDLAKKHQLRTIAFPCISTGIYGYDVEKATPVVLKTVRDWLLSGDNRQSIDKIIFCVFLIKDVGVYEHNLLQYFPVDISCTEKKKPRTKNETDQGKEQKELPEKKKPKTADSTKSESNEAKEQKDKKTKENASTKKTESKSDIEKKEKERNKCGSDTVKDIVQESSL